MKKLLSSFAILALSAAMANAVLVGSLHIDTNQDTNDVVRLSGFTTRTSNGNANTKGTVAGSFSLLAGAETNASYSGMVISTYSGSSQFKKINRYGSSTDGGVLVWDFDVTGMVTNAWELKVDYSSRAGTADWVDESGWYISFNGLGRTLDTTDVTTFGAGDGAALLNDPVKYVKIGVLPAGETTAAVRTWDLTEIVNTAATNGGSVRLVYNDHSYLNSLNVNNDSGLIAADTTSGTPVTMPSFYVSDDFETGTISTNGTTLVNDWSAKGPENKEYNVASSGILDIRDAYLGTDPLEGTNTVHEGEWETVHIKFADLPLTNHGDWVELTMDLGFYEDTSGATISTVKNPVATLTIVDSGKTNNAGYGFRMKPDKWHSLTLVDGPTAWPTEISGSDTSREPLALDGTMQTWTMRIERSGSEFLISPTFGGKLFGPTFNVETFTNSACIDAEFDQLTLSIRGNDIGAKIDNVRVYSNVGIVLLSAYEQWEKDNGLSGGDAGAGANPDLDALDNHGEYVFGGNPLDENDLGTQPVFDAATGEYTYTLRNDDSLVASVLTCPDLVAGAWTTNAPMNVTLNDGGLGSYTNNLGTTSGEMFIKLLVE